MHSSRILPSITLAAAAALTLTSCALNELPGAAGAAGDGPAVSGTLASGGASSQEAAVKAWTAGFQGANPAVTINYDPAGSGAGRESFQAGAFGLAGSDRAFTAEEIAAGPFDACAAGSGIIELPTYISPIAVVFHLEGIDSLNLDATAVAGLFSGEIASWNDPALAALNPDVNLPDLAVTPVHRADDSGTTENFTDYLGVAAPEVWSWPADGVWPIDNGEAAQGTSGVIAAVTAGSGTIGYADASRAAGEGLASAAIKVGDEFVAYSPEAAAAVVDASPFETGRADGDLAISLGRDLDAAGTYPIVLISYMIACKQYADPAVAALVVPFLQHVASDAGQQAAHETAGSAPISAELRTKVEAAIDLIAVN